MGWVRVVWNGAAWGGGWGGMGWDWLGQGGVGCCVVELGWGGVRLGGMGGERGRA